jgi:hippurate hydrolase
MTMALRRLTLVFATILLPGTASAAPIDLEQESKRQLPAAVAAYRWFHQHPEVSREERETARKLAGYLRELGMEVTEKIGGHGIVGILRGKPGGPVVLYRTDMDALPITEATGLPYASRHKGAMHACGHDMHMTVALGTMRLLKANRDRWKGTVLFVGQPAEETGSGARGVLSDRRFKAILRKVGKPRAALAIHVSPAEAAGQVALIPGYSGANIDDVDIVIHGKGGHASRPHHAVDPIVIGAEMVLALQTIVSRRVAPGEKALVSVSVFKGGTQHNIIPDTATLSMTVRSYADRTQKLLLQEIRRVAINVARSHRAPRDPEVKVSKDRCVSGYNDPGLTARLIGAFKRALGPKAVLGFEPGMGGEDFAYYGRVLKIPAVMWRLGTVTRKALKIPRDRRPGLHSSKYAPVVEPSLRTGMITAATAILEVLSGR